MAGYNDLNVTLSPRSQEALKLINQNTELSFWLKFFTSAGGSFDAVFNTKAKEKPFVVTETDFVMITKSVIAVNKIECAMIKRIASERFMNTHSDERKFWKRVNDSCTTQ